MNKIDQLTYQLGKLQQDHKELEKLHYSQGNNLVKEIIRRKKLEKLLQEAKECLEMVHPMNPVIYECYLNIVDALK